jgi:group I intron endonuclease
VNYLVYCYTNKINNKKYIGITSRSIEEREASHIYESRNKTNKCYNAPFKRAIRKYGIDGFYREIIDTADSLEKACELEKFYIKKYKTYYKYKNSNGYNATIGGELLQAPKDRVLQIDSNTLKIIHIWDSIAIAEKELNGSIYEAVNNFSRKAANSYWVYEHDFNDKTYKENIMIDRNYVCQVSKNRKLIKIWKNAKEAADKLNISQGNISMCCIGLRETTNEYFWCFYKDYINNNYPLKEKDSNKKKIIQFNDDGLILNVWESITDAGNSLNIQLGDISESCKTHKHAGGFLWRLFSEYNGEEISYVNENKTKVEKLDNNKNVICSYNSITDAANDVGVRYTGICRAIKNDCKSGGFYWRKVA